ncbi:MAG: hypothetical protein P3W95_009645 [Tepidimonas taiwanensis]|nr:hypothetical protein [Tepidimonas taiwanensis]
MARLDRPVPRSAAAVSPLAVTADVLQETLHFRQPPDTLLARTLRGPQRFGPRLREAIGDALFAALRDLPRWHWLAAQRLGQTLTGEPDIARCRADRAWCEAVVRLAWPAAALPVLAERDPAAAEAVAVWQAQAATVDLSCAPLTVQWGGRRG